MANVNVRKTSEYQAEDRTWTYADPGQWTRKSVTLDTTKFTAATHYPDGYIPSGTLLGKITASGKYGPYDAGATDGTENAVGFLWDSTTVTADDEIAPLQFHGVITEDKLPTGSGLDAAAKTALDGKFYFF